mgnify:CR=1 FL=1
MTLGQLIMDLRALQAEHGSGVPVVVDACKATYEGVERVSLVRATRDVQGEYVDSPDGYPIVIVELVQ